MIQPQRSLHIAVFTVKDFADHTQAVLNALNSAGHTHTLFHTESAWIKNNELFDAGWLREIINVGNLPGSYYKAAQKAEGAGLLFINSPNIIAQMDKLAEAKLLWAAGIAHPKIHNENDTFSWPIICKPVKGARGDGVILAHSWSQAKAHADALGAACMLQEYIENAACIRVVATQTRAVRSYIKETDSLVASVHTGALRVQYSSSIANNLAIKAVRAIGYSIAGVDILKADNKYYVLEVNSPFAFDPSDKAIPQAFVQIFEHLTRDSLLQ